MKRKVPSIVSLIVAILLVLGPHTIFPACSGMEKVMKCHWAVQAVVPLALILALLALLQLRQSTSPQIGCYRSLALVALLTSLMPLLLTLVLIGGCMSPEMACNSRAFPALNILAILSALGQVFALTLRTE